jgi:hypothetical protein
MDFSKLSLSSVLSKLEDEDDEEWDRTTYEVEILNCLVLASEDTRSRNDKILLAFYLFSQVPSYD